MCRVKYFICPMSKNIVDTVIEMNSEKLGLLPTRRQIDYNGGYVNNWNTKSFTNYVRTKSNIIIQRDHSGPLQGDGDEFFSYEDDAENFNIIHVDPWKKFDDFENGINYTINVIKHLFKLNKKLQFEIGTEESIKPFSLWDLDNFLERISNELSWDVIRNIVYVCIQSGVSLDLVNRKNTGNFNLDKLKMMVKLCKYFGKKSKEHNGDYLSDDEIKIRFENGLDAINIGPELAQIETETYLDYMTTSEINNFYEICLKSEKWKKWVTDEFDIKDKESLIMVCGHYNFASIDMDDVHDEIKSKLKIKLNQLLKNV